MIEAFKNMFKIPELRKKLFIALSLIALVRLVQNIPCPGLDPLALKEAFKQLEKNAGGNIISAFNMFSGGALQKLAIGVLGIMPYITASIILSLLSPVVPQLERMQKEGVEGRMKFQQITRYITIIICIVQSFMLATAMENPQFLGVGNIPVVINPGLGFKLTTVLVLTSSALLIMWLGEQITEKGIGQGASLIITISIISTMPTAILSLFNKFQTEDLDLIELTLLLFLFVLVTAGTVALVQGLRKIPIKYARRRVGSKIAAGQSTFLPLKINHAGVMPIIFASALMMFPPMIVPKISFLREFAYLFAFGSVSFIAMSSILILLFTFFWVATQFNPIQIADDLKKSGGFIPGYRPGEPTRDFLNKTMTRITTAGAFFLMILAAIPNLMATTIIKNEFLITQFFGGTSLLIMVGVILQTMQQVEVHLVQHNYDGFLTQGKLRSRSG